MAVAPESAESAARVAPAALTGKVVTVLGPVAPGELGVCLPHEHLICALDQGLDWSSGDERARAFAAEPVTLANLEHIHRDPLGNRANLRLDDLDEIAAELRLFAAAGGRAVVDQTLDELGRDRAALAQVARATGLHVVAGCGHYVAELQSARTAGLTIDELTAELHADLLADPRRGGIPCGLIGEIGVSSERIAPFELRMLQAVARAQRATGVPVSIHSVAPGHMGLEALLILKEHGVDPEQGRRLSPRLGHRPRLLPRDRRRGCVRRARLLRLERAGHRRRRRRSAALRPRTRRGDRRALRRGAHRPAARLARHRHEDPAHRLRRLRLRPPGA